MISSDYTIENADEAYNLVMLYDDFTERIEEVLKNLAIAKADLQGTGYHVNFYEIYKCDNVPMVSLKVCDSYGRETLKVVQFPLEYYWLNAEQLEKKRKIIIESNEFNRKRELVKIAEQKEKDELKQYLKLKRKFEGV